MSQPCPRPKSTRPWDGTYTVLGPAELDPEEDAYVQAQIAQADAEHPQDGVTMYWPSDDLATVKRAARRRGVAYKTFIRQSALAHAT